MTPSLPARCSTAAAVIVFACYFCYTTTSVKAFSVAPYHATSSSAAASAAAVVTKRQSTQLSMGLFDGVKDAFSAPALERTTIDAERETPIDRWMGWSVAKENKSDESENMAARAVPSDYVDAMDATNYITVELAKPMGIVFEENDADFGGIFVHSLKEGGVAEQNGRIQTGDQLVGVSNTKVSAMPFDDALGTIIEATGDTLKLVFFRGTAVQLYGPTGASQAWLEEFVTGAPPVAKKAAAVETEE